MNDHMLRGDVRNSTKSNARSVCVKRKRQRNSTNNHRICCTSLRGKYCTTSLKAAFYSKVINTALNDNTAEFRIANHLRGQKCANSLLDGGHAVLADRFPKHFAKKIDSMHSQIRMPSANVFNAQTCVVLSPLLAFQSASLEEVTSLIQNGKIKTSNIDPLPPLF